MVRLSHNIKVKVEQELWEKFAHNAEEKHLSASDVIRQAMYEYANKYGLQAPYKGKVKNANR